ncbi:MAG TPA: glycosyltransferase family 4 protein [Tepidisphaeraceae bacterium]|jgi:glycosyltransferase involved in cell wall biosynthesis|nr:glycosyltransferase family 4 protein [Tepidisphaeraceae bacterium]
MKVLFVTGLTGFGIGGARTEEIRLVRGAANAGCDVAMCSDVLAGELTGIRHFRLDYPPGEKAPGQLADAMREFKPELVHVVGGGVRFLADCDKTMTQSPWVFTAHNVPPAERIFPRLYGNTRLHYAVRNALAIPNVWSWAKYLKHSRFHTAICHSQTVARRLREVGCQLGKIREIPFGSELPADALHDIAASSVFPAEAWPKIVTVAGLAFHKGQLDAVRLAARLLSDFPKLSYRLIGMTRDKKYRAYVEKAIADLGMSQHVSIIHSAPEAVKFAAMREADLYVQPSHEEGFCIAFLEAAMLSPRLIGGNTGAIAAMADGDATARVVPPGAISAMAQAARELLAKVVAPQTVTHRRQALARRYSWQTYLDAHLQAYRQVLTGGN